jgi:HlyD family secretion protein
MTLLRNKWALAGAVAAIVVIVFAVSMRSQDAGTPEYFTIAADRGPIRNTVSATGVVQTVVTVQVGSQVSGQVEALYADFNSIVKRGQLLATLDPRNFQAQVQNSNANVVAVQARVRSAEAEITTHAANLQSARANLEAARVTRDSTAVYLKRADELKRRGLTSANEFETAQANADSAQAKYDQSLAAIAQVEAQATAVSAQIEQTKAQLQQALADLDRAKLNLEYCNIYSPVDGVVISRSVDVGQTIAASMQAPTLFSIANDLKRMQVNASVDEADIGSIPAAKEVRFTVDAYPNETFDARISEIRLSPTTVQNVVTYSVILSIDNAEMKLRPGMTANIGFIVDQRAIALKIPNAALRYAPPGMVRDPDAASNGRVPAVAADEVPPAPAPAASRAVARLAPGQNWDPVEKIQFEAPTASAGKSGIVWVLTADQQVEQRHIVLGMTDGSVSEVISGEIQPGELVIVGDSTNVASGQSAGRGAQPSGLGPGGGRRGF